MIREWTDTSNQGYKLLTSGGVCVYIYSKIVYLISSYIVYLSYIFLYLVLVLLKSSRRGSTTCRNNTSALGHLAAQHCQLWIVPLHILHGQKWWWQPVLRPQRRGLTVPVCPWQEKRWRRTERRKSNSPKVSGQNSGRSRKRRRRSCTSCSIRPTTAALCLFSLPTHTDTSLVTAPPL